MRQKQFTFKKNERLSRKKDIQELFQSGSSFFLFPFKVLFITHLRLEIPGHQILISVPKKYHKTAVARNLVKRRIREAYRKNKHLLPSVDEKKYFIAYIYICKEVLTSQEIEIKLKQTLFRLSKKVN